MTSELEQTRNRVTAAHKTALTLVLAFAMSIVIYAGVGLLVLGMRGTNGRAELPYAFYGAAALLAIGSIVLRRAMLNRMRIEIVAAARGIEGLIKHLFNTTIIAAAIAEIIGVLALVVAFVGGDRGDVIRLGVVALAVSFYNYPSRSSWQRVVDYFSPTNDQAGETSLGL